MLFFNELMQFINPAQLTIKRECWKALLFFIPFLIARKVVRGVSSGGAGGGELYARLSSFLILNSRQRDFRIC